MVRITADDADEELAALTLGGMRIEGWLHAMASEDAAKAALPRPTASAAAAAAEYAASTLVRRADMAATPEIARRYSPNMGPRKPTAPLPNPPMDAILNDESLRAANLITEALRKEAAEEERAMARERAARQAAREERARAAAEERARAQAEAARREAELRANAEAKAANERAGAALRQAIAAKSPQDLVRVIADAERIHYVGAELGEAHALQRSLRKEARDGLQSALDAARSGDGTAAAPDALETAISRVAETGADGASALVTEAKGASAALRALRDALTRAQAARGDATAADEARAAADAARAAGVRDSHPLVVEAKSLVTAPAVGTSAGPGASQGVPAPGELGSGTASYPGGRAGAPVTSLGEATFLSEYESAVRSVEEADAALRPEAVKASPDVHRVTRELAMRVNQLSRVHKVIFERAGQMVQVLSAVHSPDAVPPNPQDSGPLAVGVPLTAAYLARRVVAQAGVLVEKQPSAAVPLAVAVGAGAQQLPRTLGAALWRAVLYELHAACPYTVPCYLPRRDGQSNEDWKQALGYKRVSADGQPLRLESKDKYYNRVAGYVTLFAALLHADAHMDFDLGCACSDRGPHQTCARCGATAVSRGPIAISKPDGGARTGTAAAWRWLARVLNQQPRRITPVLLGPFLETLAAPLHTAYGRQFAKIIVFIEQVFVPRIHSAGNLQDEERGALSRLETILGKIKAEVASAAGPGTHEALLMPLFKEEDTTADAGGGDGDW